MQKFKIFFRGNRNGILLIEILVALVILSGSLTLVVNSLAMSLKATVFSSDYSTALIVLDNTMVDLFLEKTSRASLDQSKEAEKPYDNYQYQIRSKEIISGSSSKAGEISEVKVSVRWPVGNAGNKHRELSAATLLLDKKF